MCKDSFTIAIEDNKKLTISCISLTYTFIAILIWLGITKWSPPILTGFSLLLFFFILAIGVILSAIAAFKSIININKTPKCYIAIILSFFSFIACIILLAKVIK